jgi:hypothetical protein
VLDRVLGGLYRVMDLGVLVLGYLSADLFRLESELIDEKGTWMGENEAMTH